jgi:hypothetical protein
VKHARNVLAVTAATAGGFLVASGIWHGLESSATTLGAAATPEQRHQFNQESRHHTIMEGALAAGGLALIGCGVTIRVKLVQQQAEATLASPVTMPAEILPPAQTILPTVVVADHIDNPINPHSSVIMSQIRV